MQLPARLFLSAVLASAGIVGQDLPRAEFEVASIRPSAEATAGSGSAGVRIDGEQVRCVSLSLKDYIGMAYRLRLYQVSGPDWLGSEHFDVAARIPSESPRDQVPAMLQALLAERFQMKSHRDKKEFSVYALVRGKSGLNMKEVPKDQAVNANDPVEVVGGGNANGIGIDFGRGSSLSFSNNKLQGKKLAMANFVEALWRFMDRPVVDETGLMERYDFSIEVTPEDYQAMLIHGAVNAGVVLPPQALRFMESVDSASLFRGVEALGLKLEAEKAPLDVLVVDGISKTPTDN